MQFYKYQGTGNDFIMIDNRTQTFLSNQSAIAHLCHRRFGIGADGLILLQNHTEYDFEMVYFNADGNLGSMCGNGGRCIVRFAHDLGIILDNTRFLAADGEHLARVNPSEISLKMNDVNSVEQSSEYDFIDTGSPHYVAFSTNLEDLNVSQAGQEIRYNAQWIARGGTNVNFVARNQDQSIFVRTYERGVEDETYSCGTGVTASALSAHLRYELNSPIQIKTLGGDLSVLFNYLGNNIFENIWLSGPAELVFIGEF